MPNQLISQKSLEFRQNLRAESTKLEALQKPVTKLKFGGTIKDRQVVRSDNSRNYGGHNNISGVLQEQIKKIEREQLAPLEVIMEAERKKSQARNGKSRVPKKLHVLHNAVMRELRQLKAEMTACKGVHGETLEHKVIPKVTYKGKK